MFKSLWKCILITYMKYGLITFPLFLSFQIPPTVPSGIRSLATKFIAVSVFKHFLHSLALIDNLADPEDSYFTFSQFKWGLSLFQYSCTTELYKYLPHCSSPFPKHHSSHFPQNNSTLKQILWNAVRLHYPLPILTVVICLNPSESYSFTGDF